MLIVSEIRFQAGLGVFKITRCRCVVRLCTVRRELRDGDGCQDADDRYDDQKLDEGETFFTSEFAKHVILLSWVLWSGLEAAC